MRMQAGRWYRVIPGTTETMPSVELDEPPLLPAPPSLADASSAGLSSLLVPLLLSSVRLDGLSGAGALAGVAARSLAGAGLTALAELAADVALALGAGLAAGSASGSGGRPLGEAGAVELAEDGSLPDGLLAGAGALPDGRVGRLAADAAGAASASSPRLAADPELDAVAAGRVVAALSPSRSRLADAAEVLEAALSRSG
jgi:hypothetical protein